MPACEPNPVLLDSLRRSCVELGDSLAVPQANRGALLLRQTPPRRRLLKKLAKGVEDFLRNVMTLPLHGDGQGVIAMICKQGRILSLKLFRSSVISFFSGCLFLFETLEEHFATSALLDELDLVVGVTSAIDPGAGVEAGELGWSILIDRTGLVATLVGRG